MNGSFHQLAAADVFDVVALDLIERVGKELLQLVFLGRAFGGSLASGNSVLCSGLRLLSRRFDLGRSAWLVGDER